MLQGKEIIIHFVEVLKDEGTTSVPRWQPKEGSAAIAVPSNDGNNDMDSEDSDDFQDADGENGEKGEEAGATGPSGAASPLEWQMEELALEGGSVEDGKIRKDGEGRESIKKERKDSVGATRKERKKKDSLGSEGSSKDRKEDSEDKCKVVKKVSLSKKESLSIEEGQSELGKS